MLEWEKGPEQSRTLKRAGVEIGRMFADDSAPVGPVSPQELGERIAEAVEENLERLSVRGWAEELDQMQDDYAAGLAKVRGIRAEWENDPATLTGENLETIEDQVRGVYELEALEETLTDRPESSKIKLILGRVRKMQRKYAEPMQEELEAFAEDGEDVAEELFSAPN